ncbi:MAG TPA: FtsX-like permease family protein [Vicinamibacterales bacterium]|jgi:putative ABC transport system permease protein|nr:FtsX-like permease family protein [Vicinamibacterales bacterium]
MTISALNRKLLRDLLAMKGQAFAIAMVVAAGVAMYVMYLANFASLQETQRAYYARQRFADVFASLKRAPLAVAAEIAAIPGVSALEARVVANVTLDLEQLDEPASGRLVSIPADRRPTVNDVFLRRGRWIDRGRPDEVLASEGFVTAHGLVPGDTVSAILNGRLRRLAIVGVALSPEYIYSIRPGELVPDDKRFGVFWMDQQALAAAFDMEGGFNDVALALAPGASAEAVIARLDRILEPYGGLGAIPRALQLSHWTLENELAQLQSFGVLLPLIFLMVAAFILNVALTRALALQRPQIAALKALGYDNRSLGWHYMKFALLIGAAGVVIGLAAGAWLGSAIGDLYNQYFRFPELLFRIPLEVVLGATTLTLAAAAAGAFSAVRRAVRVPPAEAMRPEAPVRYRRTIFETPVIARRLGTVGRMVIRNVARHPFRVGASIFGIAFAVAILMVAFVFVDAIERLIVMQFWVAERQDVTVTFVEPRSPDARYALARLPGVVAVEPLRTVGARIRAGHRERYVAVTGVPPSPRLRRIVDRDGRAIRVPPSGVVLSKTLADVLLVAPGGDVTIEVLEGRRPIRRVDITGVVDDVLGLSVYMDLGALHTLLREGEVTSGALLLVDPAQEAKLSRSLKGLPAVAGAAFKRAVLRSFRDTIAANMNLTIFINLLFACVIAFGVVYNAARVSLSERSHELASLRVLGFTRAEISLILLGELALLTLLALPVGALFGYALAAAIFETVQSEVYRFPFYISRQSIAWAFLGIIAAALGSGLVVRRRLDRLDLVAVLKVRE